MKASLVTISVIFSVFLSLSLFAAGEHHHHKKVKHEAHVHGTANLKIVSENNVLSFELSAPAYDILGFEHKAKTDSQTATIKRQLEKLKDLNNNIAINKEARCKQVGNARVESAILGEMDHQHDHGHKHDHDHKHEGEGKHVDFLIKYQFNCESMSKLESITLKSFSFTKIEKVKAQALTDNGVFSVVLTKESNRLKLTK